MNTRILTTGIALVLLAGLIPVSGYHIQNTADPLSAGDWVLDNGLLIACESDGAADPRLPRAAATPGLGGLCTTGRNALTGPFADVPSSEPGLNNWTRLDMCSAPTADRWSPVTGGLPCSASTGAIGRTDTIAFTAEVGAFECLVPTTGTVLDTLGTLSAVDYALYYEELYAWWSYDGTPNATTGVYDPGTEVGYHGHVSVFIETIERVPTNPQPPTGSVETKALKEVDLPGPLDDIDNFPGDYSNECGASPSNTDDGNRGPVFVAENPATPDPPTDLPVPTAVVVIADLDGSGAAVTRVNPLWSCQPLVSSGGVHTVSCDNAPGSPINNLCLTVTATADTQVTTTASCDSGSLSATATSSLPVSANVATPLGVEGPFVCEVDASSAITTPWIGTCTVNP